MLAYSMTVLMMLPAAGAAPVRLAQAQNDLQRLELAPAPPQARGTILDSDAEHRAEQIRSKHYRSRPVGEEGNWNLDVGNFTAEPTPQEKQFENAPTDSYTGFRLRVPLKGDQ